MDRQADGDVVVHIVGRNTVGGRAEAEIEFCDPGAGGGRSPETLKALRQLAEAMQIDERTDPMAARVPVPTPSASTPCHPRLTALRHELFEFARTACASGDAFAGNREVWPVTLSTEPFTFNEETFDVVEMDESGKFYVRASSEARWLKIGYGNGDEYTQMCDAAQKAIAGLLRAYYGLAPKSEAEEILRLRKLAQAAAEALQPGIVARRDAWPRDSDVARYYQRSLDEVAATILTLAVNPAAGR